METSTAILWPVFVQVFATLALYVYMSRSRVSAVKAGQVKASDYKFVENELEALRNITNAITNQYESPVLFYAACIIAYVTATANIYVVVLAWVFAISKLVHMVLHATANRLRHRRPAFMVAFGALVFLWIVLAISLALK